MSPAKKTTDSIIVGTLQCKNYRATKAREKVATLLTCRRHAFTNAEIVEETGLPRMTVRRVLEAFHKEGFIHYSPILKGYFACQKPIQSKKKGICHSFGVCIKCKSISEFLHPHHAHPRIRSFKVEDSVHEWKGICLNCLHT